MLPVEPVTREGFQVQPLSPGYDRKVMPQASPENHHRRTEKHFVFPTGGGTEQLDKSVADAAQCCRHMQPGATKWLSGSQNQCRSPRHFHALLVAMLAS